MWICSFYESIDLSQSILFSLLFSLSFQPFLQKLPLLLIVVSETSDIRVFRSANGESNTVVVIICVNSAASVADVATAAVETTIANNRLIGVDNSGRVRLKHEICGQDVRAG
jgi:hypothetical protein